MAPLSNSELQNRFWFEGLQNNTVRIDKVNKGMNNIKLIRKPVCKFNINIVITEIKK